MEILKKYLNFSSTEREDVISTTSFLNIVVNIFVALFKVVVGFLASSIAIISEGVNNATDALNSILTLVGTSLANRRRDARHPFGYGRVEYLTSLIVSVLILIGGIEVLLDSIRRVFNPEKLNISYVSLFVVAVAAVIKYVLGTYTIKKGRQVNSDSLEAIGLDCRNDSFVSLLTIASALIFLITGKSIDAYAGIFTSCLIIKAGYEIISNTISEILGKPADKELAAKLYNEIRKTDGVINAVDMILHNYGPDAYTGSVNLEIDHSLSVKQAYEFIHALQLKIMYKYNVTMVFGIYAVDKSSPESKKLHRLIAQYVRDHEHIKNYHAVFFDNENNNIYCDLVVDYEIEDYDKTINEFVEYMKKKYPDQNFIVNIDTEFV